MILTRVTKHVTISWYSNILKYLAFFFSITGERLLDNSSSYSCLVNYAQRLECLHTQLTLTQFPAIFVIICSRYHENDCLQGDKIVNSAHGVGY